MDTDLVLTIGILLFALSLPSLLSAWVDQRVPRFGAVMVIAAVAMILAAVMYRPGGYGVDEIPGVLLAVLGRMIG